MITAAAVLFGTVALIAGAQLYGVRGDAPPSATGEQALAAFSRYQESGDPRDLETTERLGGEARESDEDDALALEALSRAALSRHDFTAGLRFAREASRLAPHRVAPVGLQADALIELGRYEEAFRLAQLRLDARPDVESYARASYVAELGGRVDAASELMRAAAEAAPTGSFARSWAQVQLALLQMRTGATAAAERTLRRGAAERPGDPEFVINFGRLAAARGDLEAARRHYGAAIDALPDADHFAELAALEARLGDRAAASRAAERSRVGWAELAEIEDVGIERAVFQADLGAPREDVVAAARRARARRPSVTGDSALAWVLARAGRCEEAFRVATHSLRLGSRDPVMHFRAGFAAACAGHEARARVHLRTALTINPNFSVRWAPVARSLIGSAGRIT